MSEKKLSAATLQREHDMAKVLKTFVPQLFSSPKIMTEGAPDTGEVDAWMLTNMPAEVLMPLVGLQIVGETDGRDEIKTFVQLLLRGLKGVGGFTARQGENIALGLGSSGGGRKIVRRPGWVNRNLMNRDWKRKAELEGTEVEE